MRAQNYDKAISKTRISQWHLTFFLICFLTIYAAFLVHFTPVQVVSILTCDECAFHVRKEDRHYISAPPEVT